MWWEKNKYVLEYISGLVVSFPASTGRDGICVFDGMLVDGHYPEKMFIDGRIVSRALEFAYSMRTGFIRDGQCWSLPDWKIEDIRRTEFKKMLELLLEEQK